MLSADCFTHRTQPAHTDLTPCIEAIRAAFIGKRISADYIRSVDGTSFAYIEFKLNDYESYARAMKIEPVIKFALNNQDASVTVSGNTVSVTFPITNGTLYIGDMLAGAPYTGSNRLTIPIGRTMDGADIYGDLGDLKHLLIAGTTGSGKSVFMQAVLISLLNKTKDVDVYIIDPKRVEFGGYNILPNVTVYTEVRDASTVLNFLCGEMERRYTLMEKAGARDISEYNQSATLPLKRSILLIDELADLMMQDKKQIEPLIVRLAQKARACGIHLIIATQYPKSEVLTGLIKMNMPTKVCFATANTTGSIVMLGYKGAEKLIGKGDMLYQTEKDIHPTRLQAAYVTQNDISIVLAHCMGMNIPASA